MQFGSNLAQRLCSLAERVVGQFKFSHSDSSDAEKFAGMNWINLSLSHIVDTVIVCPALCGAHPSSIWSNFRASKTYDNSRVSTAETCILNHKKSLTLYASCICRVSNSTNCAALISNLEAFVCICAIFLPGNCTGNPKKGCICEVRCKQKWGNKEVCYCLFHLSVSWATCPGVSFE